MRKRGLITLAAVLPVWVALYFAAKSGEIKQEGWFTFVSPQTEHVKTGILVAASVTVLGFAFFIIDLAQWLR